MNKRLNSLYKADQRDRHRLKLGDEKAIERMNERDKERQKEVTAILKGYKRLTAADYFRVAMIFQHATGKNQRRAIYLAKKSMDMGHVRAKWLYAAATDRALVSEGKKQKFGTQFKISKSGKAIPFPVDKRTTDEMRSQYNVPSIEGTKKRIEKYWEGK